MDYQGDIKIINNNKAEKKSYHERYFGEEDFELTKEQLNALLNGKALIWNDGEYSHSICLSKECFEEG